MNKVVLVGETGTGKTTFVKFLITGTFDRKYITTQGVSVHPARHIHRNGETVIMDIWDTAGADHLRGLADGYYLEGKCAVIFLDGTIAPRILKEEYEKWFHELTRSGYIDKDKIIVAVNKMEVNGAIAPNSLNLSSKTFYISVKNNTNITQLLDAITNLI